MGILGNVGVLAVETLEIAADGGDGEGSAAGQKVEKGLFFNGINVFGYQPTIAPALQLPTLVFPYPADAPLTLLDMAAVVA